MDDTVTTIEIEGHHKFKRFTAIGDIFDVVGQLLHLIEVKDDEYLAITESKEQWKDER